MPYRDCFVALRQQAAALKNPPYTFAQLLGGLGKTSPEFAPSVRLYVAGLE